MTLTADPSLEAHLEATREARLATYLDFLRIPSISADPAHAEDCRQAAGWLADRLREAGMENVEVAETGGHPIVYADWLHAEGAPTVVAYGHYDVQPVDPVDEWMSAPFEPLVVGDRVLARGASDDKSNVTILLQAATALLATRSALPVNLRFIFEGEEESSSVHLEPWLMANRERLAGDVAIVSDVGFFEGNVPALTVGLRGMMYAQIDVTGPFQDLHSGGYGGTVENPLNALCTIVAALKGPDGRVRVPGFYDEVVSLSDDERAALAALPFDDEAYRASIGVPALVGETGQTTLERKVARPTLDLNGIWGGYQGPGGKTIIPARAHAKVSCRLVADQDPARIFERFRAYVLEIAPPGVQVDVQDLGGGFPTLLPLDHPVLRSAARAMEATFGQPPLFIREGGSIPFVATFEQTLGLPTVLMGFMPPDGNFHAPNEWMDLGNFEAGIRAMIRYWDELAAPIE